VPQYHVARDELGAKMAHVRLDKRPAPLGGVGHRKYDRHTGPPAIRSLAEWALVTVQDGAVAVEFRQVPY